MLREVQWSVVLLAVVIVFSLSFSGPYLKPVIDIVFTIPCLFQIYVNADDNEGNTISRKSSFTFIE